MATIISTKTSGVGGLEVTGDASGILQLASNNGTTAVTVDASQNVGIGTASPVNLLTIQSSTSPNDTYGYVQAYYSGASVNGNAGFTAKNLSGTSQFMQWDVNGLRIGSRIKTGSGTGQVVFTYGNDSEAMRIDSSGNVLVGATSGSAKINTFVNSSQVGFYQNKPSTGNADHQQFYTDGTLFAKMNNRGSWYNFDNVYGSLSDATLKENISDATPKLNDLMQVEVRNFNFIADENKTKQLGVIAQELETVFPSMVDTDEDGIKSVKYSVFVPMLIKAIQELKAIIDTQAERIAVLENKQ